MKIRVKFFLIFLIIAIFIFSVSYYVLSLNIRRIVEKQTEQTLSSSLYTNYSIVKNLLDNFYDDLSLQVKVSDLNNSVISRNSYEIEKNSNSIFSNLNLDYLSIISSSDFIYSKTNYINLDKNINIFGLIKGKIYTFPTDQGLLVLTKLNDDNYPETNIIAGILINRFFLEKLYQEGVDITFYWNKTPFLSSNPLYNLMLPDEINLNQNPSEFRPTVTYLLKWEDRYYKAKFHPLINSNGNNLTISTMSSTIFEDQVFTDIRNNLLVFLAIFLAILLLISYFISRNITKPFYELAEGISKKDKRSIQNLLTRKDEIGELANEFWNTTEDLLNQQEQKEKINSLITHDLKTPLVAITRSLETIRDKDNLGKEQRIFFINMMIKHCNQSLELINNLLKVQKYELGKMNLFVGEENLNKLIEECVDGLKPIADEKDISINLNLDYKIDKIMLDRTEILRVISNLLSNAIKYTHESGNIKIISRIINNNVEIRISDDGKGIAIYDQKKIFNFYKTTNNTTESKEEHDIPTGLGLYLCKQIVEAHGGQIGFESYKNKGSTFYFSIPIR